MIAFPFEVLKVEVSKTKSNDKEYKIVLVTDNEQAILLTQYINECAVEGTFRPIKE